MIKKNLAIITVAIMAVLLAACGNSSSHLTNSVLEGDNDSTQTAVEEFKTYAQNGQYENAIEIYLSEIEGNTDDEKEIKTFLEEWLIEIAENFYSEDEGILSKYEDEMYTLIQINESLSLIEAESSNFLQECIENYNEGNYEEAIVCLSKIDDDIDTEAVESFKTAVSEKYVDSIVEKAEAYVDSYEFGSALTIVDEALIVLENDEQLLACKTKTEEAQEYYLLHTTVIDLTDLTAYDESTVSKISTSTNSSSNWNTDNFGNSYKTTLHCYNIWHDVAYATYRIDGVYVEMTGTIYSLNSVSGTVSIYGDGVLLYEKTITKTNDPVPFSVDITGVRDLKVTFDMTKLCIGDPTLTPDGDGSIGQ